MTAGVDYQVLHDLFIGIYGGYAGTRADFKSDARVDVNSARFGLYTTFSLGGFT